MIMKWAVKYITRALLKDRELFKSYQANIAMAFFDEYSRSENRYKNKKELLKISNTAAKNFLYLWIGKHETTDSDTSTTN